MRESSVCLQEHRFDTCQVAVHRCHGNFICIVNRASKALTIASAPCSLQKSASSPWPIGRAADTTETADRLLDDGDSFFFAESVIF